MKSFKEHIIESENLHWKKLTLKGGTVVHRRVLQLGDVEHRKLNGQFHNDLNKPACSNANGRVQYYLHHNILHRTNGPAIENLDPYKTDVRNTYWLKGKQYTKEDYGKIVSKFPPEQVDQALDALDV